METSDEIIKQVPIKHRKLCLIAYDERKRLIFLISIKFVKQMLEYLFSVALLRIKKNATKY